MDLSPETQTMINYQCGEVSKPEVQSTELETNMSESYTPPPSSFDYILKRLEATMGPQVVVNGPEKPEEVPEEPEPEILSEEPTQCFDDKANEIVEEEILIKMEIPEMGEKKADKSETPSRRVLGRGRARRRAAELCQDL